MPFRYPFRIGDVLNQLWVDALAAADAQYSAAQHLLADAGITFDDSFELPSATWGAVLTPRVDQVQAFLEDRDRALEDYLSGLITSAGTSPVFDFPGPLVISVFDEFLQPTARTYTSVIFGLTASLTAPATVEMDVSTVARATFTIPTGVNVNTQLCSVAVPALAPLQFRVLSPGSGGAGLTIFPIGG